MKKARIRVDVGPGVFSSERSVSFQAGEISYAMLVDAEDVCDNTIPVSVLGEVGSDVWVDLPRETINAGRRVRIPRECLMMG